MAPEPSPRTQSEIKAGLEFLKEEATTRKPLFYDAKNAEPVYYNDVVKLKDMDDESNNGKEVQAKARTDDDTAIVQFFKDPNKRHVDKNKVTEPFPVSISQNIAAHNPYTLERDVLRTMNNDERGAFFQGLIDRICHVDLLDIDTHNKLEKLDGKCALVTFCNHKETYYERRGRNGQSASWMEAMMVARRLLRPNGCLLTFDKFSLDDEDGYGNCMAMERIAHQYEIGLVLEAQGDYRGNDVVYMIWRNPPSGHNRMAELNSFSSSDRQRFMWSPQWPEIDKHALKKEEESS